MVSASKPLSCIYIQNILKTLRYYWYQFFVASVCAGTASKKNWHQWCVMYRYYFSLTIHNAILLLRAIKLTLIYCSFYWAHFWMFQGLFFDRYQGALRQFKYPICCSLDAVLAPTYNRLDAERRLWEGLHSIFYLVAYPEFAWYLGFLAKAVMRFC